MRWSQTVVKTWRNLSPKSTSHSLIKYISWLTLLTTSAASIQLFNTQNSVIKKSFIKLTNYKLCVRERRETNKAQNYDDCFMAGSQILWRYFSSLLFFFYHLVSDDDDFCLAYIRLQTIFSFIFNIDKFHPTGGEVGNCAFISLFFSCQ